MLIAQVLCTNKQEETIMGSELAARRVVNELG